MRTVLLSAARRQYQPAEEQTDAEHLHPMPPQITAVAQSGNLYVYAVNHPVLYYEPRGTVITSANVVGVVIGTGCGSKYLRD